MFPRLADGPVGPNDTLAPLVGRIGLYLSSLIQATSHTGRDASPAMTGMAVRQTASNRRERRTGVQSTPLRERLTKVRLGGTRTSSVTASILTTSHGFNVCIVAQDDVIDVNREGFYAASTITLKCIEDALIDHRCDLRETDENGGIRTLLAWVEEQSKRDAELLELTLAQDTPHKQQLNQESLLASVSSSAVEDRERMYIRTRILDPILQHLRNAFLDECGRRIPAGLLCSMLTRAPLLKLDLESKEADSRISYCEWALLNAPQNCISCDRSISLRVGPETTRRRCHAMDVVSCSESWGRHSSSVVYCEDPLTLLIRAMCTDDAASAGSIVIVTREGEHQRVQTISLHTLDGSSRTNPQVYVLITSELMPQHELVIHVRSVGAGTGSDSIPQSSPVKSQAQMQTPAQPVYMFRVIQVEPHSEALEREGGTSPEERCLHDSHASPLPSPPRLPPSLPHACREAPGPRTLLMLRNLVRNLLSPAPTGSSRGTTEHTCQVGAQYVSAASMETSEIRGLVSALWLPSFQQQFTSAIELDSALDPLPNPAPIAIQDLEHTGDSAQCRALSKSFVEWVRNRIRRLA